MAYRPHLLPCPSTKTRHPGALGDTRTRLAPPRLTTEPDGHLYESREERRQALRAQIAIRLARVRGGLTDTEFADLVESVALTAERFREIDAHPTAREPPPPDALGISRPG